MSESSGQATRSAPNSSRAFAAAAMILSTLPSTSPTQRLSWAAASVICDMPGVSWTSRPTEHGLGHHTVDVHIVQRELPGSIIRNLPGHRPSGDLRQALSQDRQIALTAVADVQCGRKIGVDAEKVMTLR